MSFIDISFGPMNKEFIDAYKKGEIQNEWPEPGGKTRMRSMNVRWVYTICSLVAGTKYPTPASILGIGNIAGSMHNSRFIWLPEVSSNP